MKLIANWEQSGNGQGQRPADDQNYGHVHRGGHEFIEGDNRRCFLDTLGLQSHVLYGWAVFEEHDMLHFTLARLNIAEDEELSQGCPMTTSQSKTKPAVDTGMEKVGNALLLMAENQQKWELSREKQGLCHELRLLAKEMATCTDPEVKEMLKEQYYAIKEEL